MSNKYDLPELATIFQMLSTGKHISFSDGKVFYLLKDNPEEYEAYFKVLGYELMTHPKEFYYFRMQRKVNTDSTKQMALFVFLLIEFLDKKEADLENAIMSQRFTVDALPHLKTERYRELMEEVKVVNTENILSIITNLQKYGFVKMYGRETFEFKKPVYRFFDLCVSELKKSEELISTEEIE